MGSVDHVGFNELEIRNIGVIAFEFAHVFDFFEFADYEWVGPIALGMYESYDPFGFLPAVFLGEPTGRFGKEDQGKEEQNCRDHLEAPWDAEGGCGIGGAETDFTGAIGDVEHDHNTPSDSPLLSAYKSATLRWWCQFTDIDRDLSGTDAHAETIDNTTSDEHTNILRCTNYNTSNNPFMD